MTILAVMSFPYALKKNERGEFHFPGILVRVRNGNNEAEVMGQVDSGADISIMPRKLAEFLQLDIDEAKSIRDFVESEVGVGSSKVSIDIRRGNEVVRIPGVEVRIPMDDRNQPEWLILGRYGFFTEFDVTFRENARRIELARVRH